MVMVSWCNAPNTAKADFAGSCYNGIEWGWKLDKLNKYAKFTIENKSNFVAKITGATMLTEDSKKCI